ncbi:MAG: YIP1 family protein, partial [Gammaproteobacteria bacterium]
MEISNSPGRALVDIFVDPAKAVGLAKERPASLWLPLVLMIVVMVATLAWYYGTVDFGWLRDQMLNAGNVPADQREQAAKFMTPNIMMISSIVGGGLGVVISYLIQALYFSLAASTIGDKEFRYSQWFSLATWANFPQILGFVAMALAWGFAASRQVDPGQLSVLSFNYLFFHLQMGDKWYYFLNSLSLVTFWSMGLFALGY